MGCPQCNSNKTTKENNLLTVNPGIANQWHPTKNGYLTPDQVNQRSRKKVWWECDKGHEWQDKIIARKYGNDCPYCYGIEAMEKYNISAVNPFVASQWHPTKNGELTPDKVTPGSGKKVWWKCEFDHEWKTSITSRIRGSNCPYCQGTCASEEHNLQVVNPGLVKQWHPTKNGKLKPARVTPGTDRKVWWLCENGHEWQASINNRNNGYGCPYCSGQKASKEYNLSAIHPGLVEQWHPTKNGELTALQVTPYTTKKVWWKCDKGHEWKASINARGRGNDCPYCQKKYASKEYNLQVINPGLAKQWQLVKNGNLTPDQVTPGSNRKVWWICDKGHEWNATIKSRNKGTGCPYCVGRSKRRNNPGPVN
jgi:hypothetical protein